MARSLPEKSESTFSPSHSFCRCTTFWRGTAAREDQKLVDQALRIADLDPDPKSTTLFAVALEIAKAAGATNDQMLVKQTLHLADNKLRHDDRHTVLREMAVEMVKAALASEDEKQLDYALEWAKKVDNVDAERTHTLLRAVEEMSGVGAISKDQRLLDRALQMAEKLEADDRSLALEKIAEDMAKLGHLKRARQIAERQTGLAEVEALANVVLAAVEVSRSGGR